MKIHIYNPFFSASQHAKRYNQLIGKKDREDYGAAEIRGASGGAGGFGREKHQMVSRLWSE